MAYFDYDPDWRRKQELIDAGESVDDGDETDADGSDDRPTSAPTDGPDLTLMTSPEEVLEPLDGSQFFIGYAIRKRDPVLIGAIVMAAHDAYCKRIHARIHTGDADSLPTVEQSVGLAIIEHMTSKK